MGFQGCSHCILSFLTDLVRGKGKDSGMASEIVGVQIDLLLSSFCTLEIASEPVLQVLIKRKREERSVGHTRARHPVEEVDVYHVEGKHQDVDLLLRS